MKDPRNVSSREDPDSTSSSLLERLKAQDPEGWRRLSRLYGPLVYRWCLRTGLQAADAEDVVQEVFRTVAQKIARFRREREGDTFRGWMWTITRNKIGDYLRRRKAGPMAAGGTDALGRMCQISAELSNESNQSTSSDDVGELYRRAMNLIRAEFEEHSWQAFLRVAVEGHSVKDVAADLGITPNAVYIAKSRILRRLREELGDA